MADEKKFLDLHGLTTVKEQLYNKLQKKPIEVTHAELLTLISNSGLIPGQKYLITDYETVVDYNGEYGRWSTRESIYFRLIVTADSNNVLNQKADVVSYIPANNTYTNFCSAWQAWYDPQNDASKYAWAHPNGKGVIYRLIDEWGNDCPYDFVHITMKRFDDDTDNSLYYTFDYSGQVYGGGNCRNNVIKPRYDASGKQIINNIIFLCGRYTNDGLANNAVVDVMPVESNTFGLNCHDITLLHYCVNNTFDTTCYNIKLDSECSGNVFRTNCHDNDLNTKCIGNTFNQGCFNINMGAGCAGNMFGTNCHDNSFGMGCYGCEFGINCHNNTFGDSCHTNKFMLNCNNNTFGSGCYGCEFDPSCYNNTFSDNCYRNTFGRRCYHNIFSANCQNNTLGIECVSIELAESCAYNNFKDYCSSIKLAESCTRNNFKDNCSYMYLGTSSNSNCFGEGCIEIRFGAQCNNNTFDDCNTVYYFDDAGNAGAEFDGKYLTDSKFINCNNIVLTRYRSTVGGNEYDPNKFIFEDIYNYQPTSPNDNSMCLYSIEASLRSTRYGSYIFKPIKVKQTNTVNGATANQIKYYVNIHEDGVRSLFENALSSYGASGSSIGDFDDETT